MENSQNQKEEGVEAQGTRPELAPETESFPELDIYTATGNFECCEKNTANIQFEITNGSEKKQVILDYNDIKQIITFMMLNVQEQGIREALQRDLLSELPTQESIDEMWADLES